MKANIKLPIVWTSTTWTNGMFRECRIVESKYGVLSVFQAMNCYFQCLYDIQYQFLYIGTYMNLSVDIARTNCIAFRKKWSGNSNNVFGFKISMFRLRKLWVCNIEEYWSKGFCYSGFRYTKLRNSTIGVKNVTNPEYHKKEDFSMFRKVDIWIHSWNIDQNICPELMACPFVALSLKWIIGSP